MKNLSDLDIPEHIRKSQFLSLQRENEAKIIEMRKQQIEKNSQQDEDSLDFEEATRSFRKELCPYCGKDLRKEARKSVFYWKCSPLLCGFYVVEDKESHKLKMIYKGKEVFVGYLP